MNLEFTIGKEIIVITAFVLYHLYGYVMHIRSLREIYIWNDFVEYYEKQRARNFFRQETIERVSKSEMLGLGIMRIFLQGAWDVAMFVVMLLFPILKLLELVLTGSASKGGRPQILKLGTYPARLVAADMGYSPGSRNETVIAEWENFYREKTSTSSTGPK